MPRYEFFCETCGPFEQWRPFDEANNPMRCPVCQAAARRVYSLPGLVKTPPALARALYREEKSAHEPEVVRRELPSREEPRGATVRRQARGRPWQIGH